MLTYLFTKKKYEDELLEGKIEMMKMPNTSLVPTHSHEFFEIFYVSEGHATHRFKTETRLKPGDFGIVNIHTNHSYDNCDNFTILNCMFLPELIDLTYNDIDDFNDLVNQILLKVYSFRLDGNISDTIYHDDSGRVKNIFENMLIEYQNRETGCIEVLKYLLLELLFLIIRYSENISNVSLFTGEIIKMVNERYNEHITLGEFCDEKHYSLAYASAKFKEEMGQTFTEYLQKKRISQSCSLLIETDLSISSIANMVGYSNIKFFNQLFKDITHTSPKQFRNNHPAK